MESLFKTLLNLINTADFLRTQVQKFTSFSVRFTSHALPILIAIVYSSVFDILKISTTYILLYNLTKSYVHITVFPSDEILQKYFYI